MDRSRSWSPTPTATPRWPPSSRASTRWSAEGVPLTEIAILVRTNAQLVGFEAALTARRDRVHRPRRPLLRPARRPRRPRRHCGAVPRGACRRSSRDRWRKELGFDEAEPPGSGAEARDRHAALSTLLAIGAIARGRAAGRHRGRLPRRARPSRRGRVGSRRRRRHPLDAASGQGPRVGRRLPAAARGGNAPDPPVLLRRRCARRGATPPLRRHHPRATPPRAVVGGLARRREGARRVRGRRGSSPSCGRTRSRGRRRSRASAVATFELSAADEPLLAKLIEWRRERARADGVPAYVVADNKTLAAIAVRRPSDAAGLLAVPGIGQRKVATLRRRDPRPDLSST